MAVCPNCGTNNESGKFCCNCGTPLPAEQPVQPVQPVAEPVAAPVAQPEQPVAQPVAVPVAEPVAQPVMQPVAEPTVQPVYQQPVSNVYSRLLQLQQMNPRLTECANSVSFCPWLVLQQWVLQVYSDLSFPL